MSICEIDGFLEVDDAAHRVYYRIFGDADRSLVVVHGGPGAGHEASLRFSELASDSRQVVFYDQLGCGKSDMPDDESLWNIPRYVEELETVRQKLDLGKINLLGRSWGGLIALQYALDYHDSLDTLILSNTSADFGQVANALHQHYMALPGQLPKTYRRCRNGDQVGAEELNELFAGFFSRFFVRVTPYDEDRSIENWHEFSNDEPINVALPKLQSFRTLWGPNIAQFVGPMFWWNVSDRLSEIEVPTLILCGWYDEIPPELHRQMADNIPDNEFIIFGNSSHVITSEKEADSYLAVIDSFLKRRAS